jgi:outer membrane protein assembly factor BamB
MIPQQSIGNRRFIGHIGLMISLLLSICQCVSGATEAPPGLSANDWPWWRGYHRDGSATNTTAPIHWTETNNVVWKAALTGLGHSSPIVVGTNVFLTTADDTRQTQELLCLGTVDGKIHWQKLVSQGGFMPKHANNSHASATPASDGERVFTVFLNHGRLLVSAFDRQGNQIWTNSTGPFGLAPAHEGYGSSPVLFGDFLIVNSDNRVKGQLFALERTTGKIAWTVDRRNLGSFGTPTIDKTSGRWQLILSGTGWVDAYDPLSGKPLWRCRGTAEATANTVAVSDRYALASGGAPEREMLCIRTDGQGDVTTTHTAWRTSKGVTYVPSPLHHQGHFYVLTDNGILQCLEDASGREAWSQRLGGTFKASLIRQGDHLYASSENGRTYVVKTGKQFQLIATNTLAEGAFATPSISGDSLYLRTQKHLYRLRSTATK